MLGVSYRSRTSFKEFIISSINFPDDEYAGLRPAHDKPDGNGTQVVAMKTDLEEPDMYVPSMGLMTYLVVQALHMAIHSKFHPMVFGRDGSFFFLR